MKIRLIIWLIACLVISILSYGELWGKLPQWLSPSGLQQHGVFHWGVLGLCTLWLWLKRKDILPRMHGGRLSAPFVVIGVILVILAIFLPRSDDFIVSLMLLGWLGIFTIIFGRACFLPTIFLAIYVFSVAFPLFIVNWTGESPAVAMAEIVTTISKLFGLPVSNQGALIHFFSRADTSVRVAIVPGCVGYATIGVFLALFALMMMDIRLPLKKAWYVFLIGLAGTWLQNIIRIVVSLAAGYYWGEEALDTMHYNVNYVIFPLWYALFAYIYLRQSGWKRASSKQSSDLLSNDSSH